MSTINSCVKMLRVLEDWGIDHIYGLPGGSINSTMEALFDERTTIKYIQVRHEETGALAAAADAKLTGKIGVCFGSAGPGATHLINGLYDAKMDAVPVLALLGQVSSKAMNTNAFQEMNENPLYADVSVFNRTIMSPESLPHIVDEAIKTAYQYNGVAVITIPVDFGFKDIPDTFVSTAHNYSKNTALAPADKVKDIIPFIEKAKRPVLYFGQGCRGGGAIIKEFSEHFSMPAAAAVLAKGIVSDLYPNYLGSAARVATKPANEALAIADLIICVGSNFPFGNYMFNKDAAFVQVDTDLTKFGRRHHADLAVLGDGKNVLRQLIDMTLPRPSDNWLKANQKNIKNWHAWRHSFYEDKRTPLREEPVFKEINRIAKDDAIFVNDVGNITIHAVRHLEMTGNQSYTTSGWFATMGYGIPGAIGASLSFPNRQVFNLAGDGGFSMVVQDIITQVKYNLPIINVVFSNESLGFIKAEQEDTNKENFGVDLQDADYGKIAEAMGAVGFTIRKYEELAPAFDAAASATGPVVIDVKTHNARPLPVEDLKLDESKYSAEDIYDFTKRYEVSGMPVLTELLK